jgi:prepilin-type N-terminal cleavage/methylation domain-containing protein
MLSMTSRAARRRSRDARAFTLVELLIVIALSGLLLSLLFLPIIQGFRLTNRAKALVAAQSATRFGMESLQRELGEAAYVFDNAGTPITLPLEAGAAVTRNQNGAAFYNSTRPTIAFGRLDFISPEINAPAGGVIDPTTNQPYGGGTVRVPGAASSTRYVRYFVGLQKNLPVGGVAAHYLNVYEFPRSDNDFNPFVLYRAVYDPRDPNLIVQSAPPNVISGTFRDPNFFYDTQDVGPNGLTLAQNWRSISSPVVTGPNLDVLIWQRGSTGRIDRANPFHLGASFTPSGVVADTATPGFLTNPAAEAPGAVPTLYTAQFGKWTTPFTVSVYRSATDPNKAPASAYGKLQVAFTFSPSGLLQCTVTGTGSLAADQNNSYWMFSQSTGRYFVCTPAVSFWVDPTRGRIETGLPPIASSGGVPYFYDGLNSGTATPMATNMSLGGATQNDGELIETIYRSGTLDSANAGQSTPDPNGATPGSLVYVPNNQGILFADLGTNTAPGTGQTAGYFPTTLLSTAINGLSGASAYSTPFLGFSGAMLVPGSDRVMGPNNDITSPPTAPGGTPPPTLYTYFRTSMTAGLNKNNSKPSATLPNQAYSRNSPLNYIIDTPFGSDPKLEFDAHPGDYNTSNSAPLNYYIDYLVVNQPAGLPAQPASAGATPPEIQVSFLWQNNYARSGGFPIDANGNAQGTSNGGAIRPEPDVFKIDYATRSLMNVGLGAEVYDISTGRPQISQVNSKVKINNGGQ